MPVLEATNCSEIHTLILKVLATLYNTWPMWNTLHHTSCMYKVRRERSGHLYTLRLTFIAFRVYLALFFSKSKCDRIGSLSSSFTTIPGPCTCVCVCVCVWCVCVMKRGEESGIVRYSTAKRSPRPMGQQCWYNFPPKLNGGEASQVQGLQLYSMHPSSLAPPPPPPWVQGYQVPSPQSKPRPQST